jgi:hypothetical protein
MNSKVHSTRRCSWLLRMVKVTICSVNYANAAHYNFVIGKHSPLNYDTLARLFWLTGALFEDDMFYFSDRRAMSEIRECKRVRMRGQEDVDCSVILSFSR